MRYRLDFISQSVTGDYSGWDFLREKLRDVHLVDLVSVKTRYNFP